LNQLELRAVNGGVGPVIVVVVAATPAVSTAGAGSVAWAGLAVATVAVATGIGALGQSMGWWGSAGASTDLNKPKSGR